jgi:hypothetical protein
MEREGRWWNLAGFLLRPGFGYPLDDFRVKELWKIMLADLKVAHPQEIELQKWICCRRIAGGLNRGLQSQVAAVLWPQLIEKGKISFNGKAESYQYMEKLRTAAALELIDIAMKVKLGNAIIARAAKHVLLPAELWALGRLGARHLFHGGADNVVPRDTACGWLDQLLACHGRSDAWLFAVGQIARKTDHREINLPQAFIDKLLTVIEESEGAASIKSLLTGAAPLTQNEQNMVFGEQLPAGLMLQL